MKTVYIQELKRYSKSQILEIIDEKTFEKLQKYAIITQDEDSYQVNYVGVIIVKKTVINCYPKYIPNEDHIEDDFKQILKVIKKYNNLYDDFEYQNDNLEDISFNLLSMMVFFLEDYFENGIYNNIQNILEINGNGEIDWNRTINYTDPIMSENRPYYVELYTKYKIDDLFDYFRLLHEYIITVSSKRLEEAGLLELFDLTPVDLSNKTQDDFGEKKFILEKLEKEVNVEFNTHKLKILKAMHTFIKEENSFSNENYLTLYGTSTYHVIWEEMCSKVLVNKLHKAIKDLNLNSTSTNSILNVIKKPKWVLNSGRHHKAMKSFEPDIVTFDNGTFIILDAKYYKLKFDENTLYGQPGLGDITKQYLYELALKDFRIKHGFKKVKNALLFPKYDGEIENKGYVEIEILHELNLENIQIIMLPADKINQMYLENKKMNILLLNL